MYRYLGPLYNSETGEIRCNEAGRQLCGYLHLYPHARQLWDRPIEDFFGDHPTEGCKRFRDIRDG